MFYFAKAAKRRSDESVAKGGGGKEVRESKDYLYLIWSAARSAEDKQETVLRSSCTWNLIIIKHLSGTKRRYGKWSARPNSLPSLPCPRTFVTMTTVTAVATDVDSEGGSDATVSFLLATLCNLIALCATQTFRPRCELKLRERKRGRHSERGCEKRKERGRKLSVFNYRSSFWDIVIQVLPRRRRINCYVD